MRHQISHDTYRALLDTTLTELALYAKALCPEAAIEASALQYEEEDGRVEVFPLPGLSEAEEERIEHALGGRSAEIFAQTGLYIPCAILDASAR